MKGREIGGHADFPAPPDPSPKLRLEEQTFVF
jgi:hypothetical protein